MTPIEYHDGKKSKNQGEAFFKNEMLTRFSILFSKMPQGILGVTSAPPTTLRISLHVFM
jgi:hypothetical protein